MLFEENMTTIEPRSALSVPQSTKQATPTKTQSNVGTTDKHCTNSGMTNHNVETCRKKKKQTTMATIEVAQPSQKTQKTYVYACHIYGLNGHKIKHCPKFVEMQKMFHGKYEIIIKVQLIAEAKKIMADVNVANVKITTRSKVTKEHVFKDRKPRKTKCC
jgi:hypothetical protein